MQVLPRARGENVSFIDVKIPEKGWPVDVNDVMHRKCAKDFGRFEKVSWVEFCLGRRRLAFACSLKPVQWPLWRVPHMLAGGRWKSQNRKNVYLSPYVEEPLNSKVIKSFVPELRSRKCFSCFEIPMFYVYKYEHAMSISHMAFIMAMVHKHFSLI